ncbi:hypothetical protein F5146DRAFT_994467 [Armillaria mellea]|nr:hypothetical protein F5146DRAFT_994467 [Armillaria mellea]
MSLLAKSWRSHSNLGAQDCLLSKGEDLTIDAVFGDRARKVFIAFKCKVFIHGLDVCPVKCPGCYEEGADSLLINRGQPGPFKRMGSGDLESCILSNSNTQICLSSGWSRIGDRGSEKLGSPEGGVAGSLLPTWRELLAGAGGVVKVVRATRNDMMVKAPRVDLVVKRKERSFKLIVRPKFYMIRDIV